MKKFVNEQMAAPNLFTVPIDLEIAKTLSLVATQATPMGHFAALRLQLARGRDRT